MKICNGSSPSLEVLEGTLALKKIDYDFEYHNTFGAAPFQPVITALQHGIGLKLLQAAAFSYCELGDLESSGCANQMTVLSFTSCQIGVEGARTLADLLRLDGLPALESLRIRNEGVVALAEAHAPYWWN